MTYRTLEINVSSAKDLKDVNLLSKMDVYAVVSIAGDSSTQHKEQKTKTPVDRSGGSNPTWNFPIKFTIDESLALQNRLCLDFKLRCDRVLGDKDIGEVNVPIKELLDSPGDGKSMQFVSYQVRKPSGKPKGELRFSYKFGDLISAAAAAAGPAHAYPVQVSGPSYPPYSGPIGAYPTSSLSYGGPVKVDVPVSAYPPHVSEPSSIPYGRPVKADVPVSAYPPQVGGPSSVPYGGPVKADVPVGVYLAQVGGPGFVPDGGPVKTDGPGSAYPSKMSGPSFVKADEPVTAYPAQPGGSTSGPNGAPAPYAHQPTPAGYPCQPPPGGPGFPPQQPPPRGYGYPPPPPPDYGYPPVQRPPKKNKPGMGLGAGLVGGMLGGLLIGDMVSDAADYDMGGFDF